MSTWSCGRRGGGSRERAQAAGHPEVDEQGVAPRSETAGICCAGGRRRRCARQSAPAASGEPASADRRSYTCMTATRRPTTSGAIPRRVVSTSGSSGMGPNAGLRDVSTAGIRCAGLVDRRIYPKMTNDPRAPVVRCPSAETARRSGLRQAPDRPCGQEMKDPGLRRTIPNPPDRHDGSTLDSLPPCRMRHARRCSGSPQRPSRRRRARPRMRQRGPAGNEAGAAAGGDLRRPDVPAADRRHRVAARRSRARRARLFRGGARRQGCKARAPRHRDRARRATARAGDRGGARSGRSSNLPRSDRSR